MADDSGSPIQSSAWSTWAKEPEANEDNHPHVFSKQCANDIVLGKRPSPIVTSDVIVGS